MVRTDPVFVPSSLQLEEPSWSLRSPYVNWPEPQGDLFSSWNSGTSRIGLWPTILPSDFCTGAESPRKPRMWRTLLATEKCGSGNLLRQHAPEHSCLSWLCLFPTPFTSSSLSTHTQKTSLLFLTGIFSLKTSGQSELHNLTMFYYLHLIILTQNFSPLYHITPKHVF